MISWKDDHTARLAEIRKLYLYGNPDKMFGEPFKALYKYIPDKE